MYTPVFKYLSWLCLFTLLFSSLCFAETTPLPPIEPQEWVEAENESDHFTSTLLNMVMTLVVFLGVLLALTWFLKRMMAVKQEQGNMQSTIKVVAQRALSAKTMVYVIEVEGQSLVIAESAGSVAHLTNLPVTIAPASSSFRRILDQPTNNE
jgi:flagellar biosynthetic protein FliO